jgi:serine/threonine protein kinase
MAGFALFVRSEPAMRARPPRLPGYVLGTRLGGGPTCDVYSAFDDRGRPGWAIKILREEAAGDPTNLQLLRREARAGMAVRHPNLVRVVRAGPAPDRPRHLVMRRIPGRPLRTYLRPNGWLDPRLVCRIGRQIAAALAAMHSAGFVHGDVKPDNVHLSADRNATLLDLGFAHRPDKDGNLLGDDFVLGTANYIAPELCHRPQYDTSTADVFSLGITLFELLTGKLPYPMGDVDETMLRHRDGEPDSLWRWDGNWPIGLSALVDRMLDRDPARRPSAADVGRELTTLRA